MRWRSPTRRRVVRPFHGGGQNELAKQPKVYGFDTGFVSFARGLGPAPPRRPRRSLGAPRPRAPAGALSADARALLAGQGPTRARLRARAPTRRRRRRRVQVGPGRVRRRGAAGLSRATTRTAGTTSSRRPAIRPTPNGSGRSRCESAPQRSCMRSASRGPQRRSAPDLYSA